MPPSLPRASSGRRERRRVHTRERLFRTALRLFARRGFFETRIEDITEAVDVGKGTFFNYFPSKEHLLAAFGEMQLGKVQGAVLAAQESQEPVRRALRRLLHSLAEEPGRSQALVRSLLMANLSSRPIRRLLRRNLGRGRRLLGQMIVQGQRQREIRRELRPALVARLFQQTFFGTLMLWTLHPPSQLRRWMEASFEVLWSGIAARRRP